MEPTAPSVKEFTANVPGGAGALDQGGEGRRSQGRI